VHLPLPLINFHRVKIEGVPQERIDKTIHKMLTGQRSYTCPTITAAVLFIVVGLLLFYIGLIVITLTFMNPFLIVILVMLVIRYARWSYRSLKQRILKRQRLTIRQLLEIENREYYYKKLIKWKIDEGEHHIVIENLRLK
jgi:Flp pilus assembly protein TadB